MIDVLSPAMIGPLGGVKGLANVAEAITDESSPTANRVIQGLAGGLDIAKSIPPPAPPVIPPEQAMYVTPLAPGGIQGALTTPVPGTNIPVAGAIAALLGAALAGADAENPEMGAALAGLSLATGLGGAAIASSAAGAAAAAGSSAAAASAVGGATAAGIGIMAMPMIAAISRDIAMALHEPSHGERERAEIARYQALAANMMMEIQFASTPEELARVLDRYQSTFASSSADIQALIADPGSYHATLHAGILPEFSDSMSTLVTIAAQQQLALLNASAAGYAPAQQHLTQKAQEKTEFTTRAQSILTGMAPQMSSGAPVMNAETPWTPAPTPEDFEAVMDTTLRDGGAALAVQKGFAGSLGFTGYYGAEGPPLSKEEMAPAIAAGVVPNLGAEYAALPASWYEQYELPDIVNAYSAARLSTITDPEGTPHLDVTATQDLPSAIAEMQRALMDAYPKGITPEYIDNGEGQRTQVPYTQSSVYLAGGGPPPPALTTPAVSEPPKPSPPPPSTASPPAAESMPWWEAPHG